MLETIIRKCLKMAGEDDVTVVSREIRSSEEILWKFSNEARIKGLEIYQKMKYMVVRRGKGTGDKTSWAREIYFWRDGKFQMHRDNNKQNKAWDGSTDRACYRYISSSEKQEDKEDKYNYKIKYKCIYKTAKYQ